MKIHIEQTHLYIKKIKKNPQTSYTLKKEPVNVFNRCIRHL